ncbi:hypothetical protein L207DRAFT_341045 [Hyaloscypha variabilis F]|uniref:Transcription factor domain-containing protein n=1 Tax=Hyaloscypha variabilis (strain UAMH 11265 / GT02V1 / F) TaxID=1149755 RepID=A0A2J6RPV8_HYAVF|nr:hypothetical protein L207DRAFT_341045 [Hyaloscypha variabilis F]
MAAELQQFLATLDLEQYFLPCLQAGIQTWEAFINVTEPEFNALHIRRGHRRRIQREIARRRLWPDSRPLPTSAEQLRQHTQDLRRMSRGIGSEHIEESFYALRSFTQSPWSSTSSSTESEARSVLSTHEKSKTIRQHVADLVRPRESDPPAKQQQDQRSPISSLRDADQEKLRSFVGERGLSWLYDVLTAQPEASPSTGDVTSPHLLRDSFCANVAPYLFLYSNSDLRRMIFPRNDIAEEELSIDTCLILALGAKYGNFRADPSPTEWYAKARVRLFVEPQDDLSLMRTLALICLFEISDDVGKASQILSAALSLGQANGFDAEEVPLQGLKEAERYQWLRVWETMRFLNIWCLLRTKSSPILLKDTSYFLDIGYPPLESEECYNSRLTQMSLNAVGMLLREVLKDGETPSKFSTSILYRTHLKALDSWHAELPTYLCLHETTPGGLCRVDPASNERQKTAIFNVHALFLGTVCELLKPALIASTESSSTSTNELETYANRCIESALRMTHLCKEMVALQYPLSSSWIAQHFLLNSASILIYDVERTRAVSNTLMPKN